MSTIIYFAYGSNMDAQQMAERCPGAEAIGAGTLPGYRFIINNRGYATLRPEKDTEVPGVLWQLKAGHEAELDRYEGYRRGLYDKCFRDVTMWNQSSQTVLVYIDHRNQTLGAPKDGYLERIIQAARRHHLPDKYRVMLENWPNKKAFAAFKGFVNEFKSFTGFPENMKPFVGDASVYYMVRKDSNLLAALDRVSEQSNRSDLPLLVKTFFEIATAELMEWGRLQSIKYANQQAQRKASFERFLEHIDDLDQKGQTSQKKATDGYPGEIGTAGIIITADTECRGHDGDKIIVTPHAPLLAWLWCELFSDENGVAPRDALFMEAFAKAAVKYGNATDAKKVLSHALAEVRGLAQREIEAIHQK